MTNGTRVLVVAVLGRALTSTDFGIVAAALSVNAIVYGIRDFGIGPALIQRKDLDAQHLTTAFASSIYIGFALATLLFFSAPMIGRAYGIEQSIDVIRALSVLFALRSISSTSRVICQRAMNFRLIALIDASSYCVGSIVAITSALLGAGPWALVAGYLVEEVIASALYLARSPTTMSLQIDRTKLRELLSFGIAQSIIQSANIGATFGDNIVVGNAMGARPLGIYTRAYDLIKFPSMVFDAIVGNVLFPAFSRWQNDRPNLATSFRRVAFVNALVLLPASTLIIVLAPEAIRVLMGTGWDDAVLPFQILSLTILLRTNLKLGGILAQAAGAVNAVAIAYVIYMVVIIGGAIFALRWGIVGVATSTAIGITTVTFHCCYLALRVSGLRLGEFLRAHVPGLIASGLVLAMAWPSAAVLRGADLPAAIIFTIIGLVAIALCLVLVVLGVRRGRGDFLWLGEELARVRKRKARR